MTVNNFVSANIGNLTHGPSAIVGSEEGREKKRW